MGVMGIAFRLNGEWGLAAARSRRSVEGGFAPKPAALLLHDGYGFGARQLGSRNGSQDPPSHH